MKWMGVWFSQYPDEEVSLTLIDGTLEPKDHAGGYLLFHTLTHGSWNPVIEDGRVHVKLLCKLTSQKWLKTSVNLRVRTEATELEEFSPGLVEHLQHPSTWHHDLSLHK